jgi:small redox-active disulfide protein 2
MQVKVLGAGCSNCHALEDRTGAALRRLGIDDEIEMITDYGEIVAHGVMSTPALVVEDRVPHRNGRRLAVLQKFRHLLYGDGNVFVGRNAHPQDVVDEHHAAGGHQQK